MPASDYAPTLAEIGKRIKARTLATDTGKRIGTFTDETNPTAEDVQTYIEDGLSEVAARIGTDIDNEYWPPAKFAVIMHVCMTIELSMYPESTNDEGSAYKSFEKRFNAAIEAINEAMKQIEPNERRVVSLRQGSLVRWGGFGRLDPWFNELLP